MKEENYQIVVRKDPDTGRVWLEADMLMLMLIGMSPGDFSQKSYLDDGKMLLEGDTDGLLFLRKYVHATGEKPVLVLCEDELNLSTMQMNVHGTEVVLH